MLVSLKRVKLKLPRSTLKLMLPKNFPLQKLAISKIMTGFPYNFLDTELPHP